MKALDRKLLRDLRLLWSQALTIALVVASGIGGLVTSLSAVDSLAQARDDFYAVGHFADLFAEVKRAPNSLAATLRAVPGVRRRRDLDRRDGARRDPGRDRSDHRRADRRGPEARAAHEPR